MRYHVEALEQCQGALHTSSWELYITCYPPIALKDKCDHPHLTRQSLAGVELIKDPARQEILCFNQRSLLFVGGYSMLDFH